MQRWLRVPARGSRVGARWLARLSAGRTWLVIAIVGLGMFAGCDANSFVPPRPDDLRVAGGGVPDPSTARVGLAKGLDSLAASARAVELILDRRDADEAEIVTSQARIQAGIDKAKLKINIMQVQDLPARQAELVEEALLRNPLALIVEPADPADRRLAEAVEEARGKGVPVVLLGRPLESARPDRTGRAGGEPANAAAPVRSDSSESKTAPPARQPGHMTLVTVPSFAPFAKQLVDSSMRNAKNAKLDPTGGAIIVVNTSGDPFINDRLTALRGALQAAGVKTIELVSFAKQVQLGKNILIERLKAQPKVSLVFAIDTQATTVCREAVTELFESRPFVMAAFASESSISDMTRSGDYAGVAEFAPLKVLRKAISTAVALSQGREVPARIELPVMYYDSPPDSALSTTAAHYKAKTKKGTK
jgi:ABC-type sugar transport system substrate-binding protein